MSSYCMHANVVHLRITLSSFLFGFLQNADPDVRVDMETFLSKVVPEVWAPCYPWTSCLITFMHLVWEQHHHNLCSPSVNTDSGHNVT